MRRETIALLALVLVLFLAVLLARCPWITDDYARETVKTDVNFIRQHGSGTGLENPEIHVAWIPFGRWVTTYEGGWLVTFYGGVI